MKRTTVLWRMVARRDGEVINPATGEESGLGRYCRPGPGKLVGIGRPLRVAVLLRMG
jgi:hypothetical protein